MSNNSYQTKNNQFQDVTEEFQNENSWCENNDEHDGSSVSKLLESKTENIYNYEVEETEQDIEI